MIRSNLHLVAHFLVPAAIAAIFFRDRFWRVWLVLCLTMLVDVDHLLADPVYDPGRCSIGFHPLHSYVMIVIYGLATLITPLRLVAIGLLTHMFLDGVDCIWMGL